MSAPPYKVGIIGLGNIAQGYDAPGTGDIRTHVAACLAEPRFRLAALCDVDEGRARAVRDDWGLDADIVAPDGLSGLDVICISSPDETHLSLLDALADHPPRLVLCEKPLARDPAAAEKVVARLRGVGCAVAVNHLRRWIPALRDWLAAARSGAYGACLGATAHYSAGFWRNGTHAVDLITAFRGEDVSDIHITCESAGDDPLLTVHFGGADAPVRILGINGAQQTIFDVDILFEGARIRVHDEDGVRARLDLPAPVMGGAYAPELRPAAHYHDRPPRLMAEVWSNLADHLEAGAPLACNAEDALATLWVQAAIEARARDNER